LLHGGDGGYRHPFRARLSPRARRPRPHRRRRLPVRRALPPRRRFGAARCRRRGVPRLRAPLHRRRQRRERAHGPRVTMTRWGVVGGGVLGLMLAHRLAERGDDVTLIEGAPEIGGLAAAWQLGDVTWDRHYHVTLLSDRRTQELV